MSNRSYQLNPTRSPIPNISNLTRPKSVFSQIATEQVARNDNLTISKAIEDVFKLEDVIKNEVTPEEILKKIIDKSPKILKAEFVLLKENSKDEKQKNLPIILVRNSETNELTCFYTMEEKKEYQFKALYSTASLGRWGTTGQGDVTIKAIENNREYSAELYFNKTDVEKTYIQTARGKKE